ncbi:Glutathione S-transferase [Caenispirillum salinarum AK4]|uniref:Glutathione S-transferase n=2 Tax=Caenispirillum TaxID=414051 RepID=K9HR19_9PROT|nr:Glutathione S-transferase [Caenispirillum salinarum AK4]
MGRAMSMTLVIGNKNYSSWSLRPWLVLKAKGLAFDEELLPLFTPEFRARLAEITPAGRVPVLLDGAITVWDSLAIIEYLNDRHDAARVWPAETAARAQARCIAAEMHSGFTALRGAMPMNCRKDLRGRVKMTDALKADIDRIAAIWRDTRAEHGAGGPFLFGGFTAADAMFAPVASRFRTYGVDLDAAGAEYMDAILSMPEMKEWYAAAEAEPWVVNEDELPDERA